MKAADQHFHEILHTPSGLTFLTEMFTNVLVILLQIVIVSPGIHLAVNKSWVPLQNDWVPVQKTVSPKLKMLGPFRGQTDKRYSFVNHNED